MTSVSLRSRMPAHHVRRIERQRTALIVAAPDEDVKVRVIRVVVIDGHPLEAGPEVLLHPRQERSRVRAEVEPGGLLGRHDQLEEPRVTGGLPALQGLGEIEVVPVGGEASPLLALALGTLPREVGAVRPPAGAAAARGVGDLDGAALTLPRLGQEQRCAPGSETLPTASAPTGRSRRTADGRGGAAAAARFRDSSSGS